MSSIAEAAHCMVGRAGKASDGVPRDEQVPEQSSDGLWSRLWHSLVGWLKRMAGHRQVAEDVASETCLRAWKKFRDRVPWADLWAWSVRVARNLLVNHWRAEKRERIETGRSTELLPFGATELEAGDGWKARVHILVVCPCPN